MKGIVCKVCNFVALDGTTPEQCPVCHAAKTAFTEKEDALKTVQNIAASGESEKKHVPSIKVVKACGLIPDGCTDVHVKVGEIQHPMTAEHSIVHLDFYVDKKYVSRVSLTPEKLNPAAGLHLKASSGKVAAVAQCNVHGAWFSETDL